MPESYYLNDLYVSGNPDDVIEFYKNFDSREGLIKWMAERPGGRASIHDVDGNDNLVFVVTTADYQGKSAIECRESVFKGHRTIFVESGGRNDKFFNLPRNINIGLKYAIKHRPDWIIYSNDDVYKIDDLKMLENGLSNFDQNKLKTVVLYHENPKNELMYDIVEPNKIRDFLYRTASGAYAQKLSLQRKFSVKYTYRPREGLPYYKFLYRRAKSFRMTSNMFVFSLSYVEENDGTIFDENYLNGMVDVDISLRIAQNKGDYGVLKFRLGNKGGSTLGASFARELRDISSWSYFNYKIEKGLISIGEPIAR